MSVPRRAGVVTTLLAILAGCASAPAPRYQPLIANSELLLRLPKPLAVDEIGAASGVGNRFLHVGVVAIDPGGDGTFSGYVRNALITELTAVGRYDAASTARLSGTLLANSIREMAGAADLSAEFVLVDADARRFRKIVSARQKWRSALIQPQSPAANIDRYIAAVQHLLNSLFSDPEFATALRQNVDPQPTIAQ